MPTDQGPQARPALDDALRGLSPVAQIDLVNGHVGDRLAGHPGVWVAELAGIVDGNGLELRVLRRCASNLAWRARELALPLPGEDLRPPDGATTTASYRLAHAYVRAARLRYDFRFDALLAWTRTLRAEFPDDGLIRSFAAFAALGKGAPQAAALLRSAADADDYDQSCRFLCLHGLWISASFEGGARLAVELADEMIGLGEDDSNVHYWRAGALRRAGRLVEALESIDLAIDVLPPGNNAIHTDYVRERELVSATKVLDERVDAMTDRILTNLQEAVADQVRAAQQEIEEEHAQARRIVSESLIGIVEVLAIFVTLAGFLVTSGTVLLQAHGFWQNLAAVAVILLGCVTLFVLLRKIVNQRDVSRTGAVRRVLKVLGRRQGPSRP